MDDFLYVVDKTIVPLNTIALFWLEQSHFIIKTSDGILIHIDPFLSRAINPENHIYPSPLIKPEESHVDYVFLTHDHRDHTDPYTIAPMAKANPDCIFVGTQEAVKHCKKMGVCQENLIVMEECEERGFDKFQVKAVFAQDTADDESAATTHVGYVFNFNGVVVYNVGDTRNNISDLINHYSSVKDLRPDVMLVPINTGYNNPGPSGAARLVELVKPHFIIPCHFDCFINNTIDPSCFVEGLPGNKRSEVIIMSRGGKVFISNN